MTRGSGEQNDFPLRDFILMGEPGMTQLVMILIVLASFVFPQFPALSQECQTTSCWPVCHVTTHVRYWIWVPSNQVHPWLDSHPDDYQYDASLHAETCGWINILPRIQS